MSQLEVKNERTYWGFIKASSGTRVLNCLQFASSILAGFRDIRLSNVRNFRYFAVPAVVFVIINSERKRVKLFLEKLRTISFRLIFSGERFLKTRKILCFLKALGKESTCFSCLALHNPAVVVTKALLGSKFFFRFLTSVCFAENGLFVVFLGEEKFFVP